MKIQVNERNEIIAYADCGDIVDSVEYDKTIPDGFFECFKPGYYLLQNDQIVVNPNYQEPTVSIPEPQPSEADKQLAKVTYQQMMTTQDVTTLQTQNAQMAYQLMMIQQGGEA